MKRLTKQQIIEAQDIEAEDVLVPEWGDGDPQWGVTVKAMNGAERDAFEASRISTDGKKVSFNSENIRARIAAICMVDERGERLFTDQEVTLLGRKSAAALDRVYEVAQRLSGLSKQDMETLEGNSASGPSSSSTTVSA